MNKTFFKKISHKSNLDESPEEEEPNDHDDNLTIYNYNKIKEIQSKFNLRKSLTKQVSMDIETSKKVHYNNIKRARSSNINLCKNENYENLESDKINFKFLKRFNSKLSEDKIDKFNNVNKIINEAIENEGINVQEFRFSTKSRINQKKIFEEFLSIGIEKSGLEYINDHDELFLTPKILFNYPKNLNESELNYNIKFLKNFCFNEGVKVKRYILKDETDYDQFVLEENFFSKNKTSFCLVQQITPENLEKYYIFGIRFDDFYIVDSKLKKNKNIFIYDKTYLFISTSPLFKLFESILQSILNVKKLNFFKNLDNYEATLVDYNIRGFENENSEKISEQISEVLKFFFDKNYPRFEEYIGFKSNINHLSLNYYHSNKFNQEFLAIDWLSKTFFKLIDVDSFYTILIRILLEQSFIFICRDIEILTTLVLGFSFIIRPFSWPFILIPNLPLDLLDIVESPVPYLLGILDDGILTSKFNNNSNVVRYRNNKIEIILNQELECKEPILNNLKLIIRNNLSNAHYHLHSKNFDEYHKYCETIYKNIYANLKSELADPIEKHIFNEQAISQQITSQINFEMSQINIETFDDLNAVNYNYSEFNYSLNKGDEKFAKIFLQTQIFQFYFEEIKGKQFDVGLGENYI